MSGDQFTLGARRLSIIDVEGGRQPLTNEDGTIEIPEVLRPYMGGLNRIAARL